MFDKLKNIIDKVRNLNVSVDNYKQDSVIQSLPNVAYVNQAKKFIDKKQFKEAEEYLLKAIEISNQDSRAHKYLGKIYESQYKYNDALNQYEASSALNPQDKEIWLRIGMCRIAVKNFEQAIKSFEKADKVTPMNTDVQTGWGMALMRLKKYALARDKFALAAKISKYNYTAILLSAVMEIRLEEYKAADVKLTFLTKIAPNESSCYELANLRLIQSNYKDAEKFALQALSFNKLMLPAYFVLGEVYSIMKDDEKTDNIFNQALSNDMNSDALQFEWAKADIRLFNFEQARNHFNQSLEKNNDFINSKIGIALLDALDGNFEMLSELSEKNGGNVYIQEALGLKYMSDGEVQEAIEMFKKAYKTDINQSYNLLHLARAYKQLNNKDKAREYYEKFVSENPKYIAGLLEYSAWLIEISDFADAKRKLQKTENLSPNDTDILNLLFYSQYRLVKENISEYNLKEAISLAEKIMTLGDFKYEPEKLELENILKDIQGK